MAKKESYKELKKIDINGTEQWISIRGKSLDNPLLLFLHGGPGGSEMATAYTHYGKSELEKNFIVVNWDQRGSGKSYDKNIDPNTMTIEQLVNDGLEVTKILLREFGKSKIYLVGHSWGSILGMKMIARDSGLFYSYIGISQLVNMSLSEQRSLDISIDLAHKLKNKKAIQELQALKDFDSDKENFLRYMDVHRSWLAKLGGLYYSGKRIHPNMLFIGALFSPEYKISDVVKLKNGLVFSVKNMWAEIMNIDLLNENWEFDIPIYFICGKADNISHPQLIEEYYNKIKSPGKELVEFEYSGHSPHFDEWEKYEKTVIRLLLKG
ncbi:proline iminopeptidase [Ruminiclostridium hungatei]|uniref:Proline iminopeptidase n=1 Tax=Ruminiclostridium hungatei TaxID=48256 RepID=A0A1V4SLJ2_RUMHU|nr:alpha/beta hydrolase [Ruminiclostridium hungatei]OPX44752.1 proline iminopeptidase [Ruminiclostridium hungatei]